MREENKPGEATTNPASDQVICKNCTHSFSGNFCPQCGQSIRDFDRPLQLLIIDFTGNLFAFDTRLWKSLKHILFFPGRMERQYLEGKRRRYMPPFRLYVFTSFLFFLTLSFVAGRSIRNNKDNFQITSDINLTAQDSLFVDSVFTATRFKVEKQLETIPEHHRSNLPDSLAYKLFTSDIPADNLEKKSKINMQSIMDNPEIYMDRFFKYLSWTLFLLMPFYGFLLWINFRKSKTFYLAHFLLSINHHVLFFLLAIIILLIQFLFPSKTIAPENYLLWVFPAYAWLGVHQLYKRKWYATTLRLLFVLGVYLFVALFTSAILLIFALI